MTKMSAYNKTWRERHPEKWRKIQQKSHLKRYADPTKRAKILTRSKERHKLVALVCLKVKTVFPCFDCGRHDLPYLMDFDHFKGIKNRAPQSCRDLHELARELKLCQVVCVRCHRIRTYNRRRNAAKT